MKTPYCLSHLLALPEATEGSTRIRVPIKPYPSSLNITNENQAKPINKPGYRNYLSKPQKGMLNQLGRPSFC
jgi:hypothetical protein